MEAERERCEDANPQALKMEGGAKLQGMPEP